MNRSLGAPIPDTVTQNLDCGADEEVVKDTPVYEKYNELIHGGMQSKSAQKNIVSMPFLKKYIHYAKSRIKPVLTQGAADKIANEYTSIRNQALEDSQKVTIHGQCWSIFSLFVRRIELVQKLTV
jgi:DNA replication licensing factor MCM3